MLTQAAIDARRHLPLAPRGNLIDGRICPAAGGETFDSISPIDGRVLTRLARSGPAEIDAAVAAARRAFDAGTWSRTAPAARKRVLLRWAELIEAEALDLAVLGVRDNGTEIAMAHRGEPLSAAATLRYYAEAVDKVYGEIAPTGPGVLGLIHREPKGVVGAIVPWNFPMMIGAWKLAPALAAGNSLVLKPSEEASLTLLRMAELALEAGLPPGVLNVVTGGAEAGDALARHMDVDILAFTGSGQVGRRLLAASAASNLKPVYLELGGKSPNIVFADAPDLARAAQVSGRTFFRNSGQVCVSAARVLVQEEVRDRFLAELLDVVAALKVGDPLDLGSDAGAVATRRQLDRNLAMVAQAEAEGARCLAGGGQLLAESGGFYMAPTVFDRVTPSMALFRQEVFGPVLSVTTFRDEAEALALANDSVYGLSSAVWTGSLARAHRMIGALQAGVVMVNGSTGSDNTVTLGGVKQSGNGYDKSLHALDKYQNLKAAWIDLGV
ncbi:MAG: aldehyde dehydrogenase family protein [Pseudodonghicola sp.]